MGADWWSIQSILAHMKAGGAPAGGAVVEQADQSRLDGEADGAEEEEELLAGKGQADGNETRCLRFLLALSAPATSSDR